MTECAGSRRDGDGRAAVVGEVLDLRPERGEHGGEVVDGAFAHARVAVEGHGAGGQHAGGGQEPGGGARVLEVEPDSGARHLPASVNAGDLERWVGGVFGGSVHFAAEGLECCEHALGVIGVGEGAPQSAGAFGEAGEKERTVGQALGAGRADGGLEPAAAGDWAQRERIGESLEWVRGRDRHA